MFKLIIQNLAGGSQTFQLCTIPEFARRMQETGVEPSLAMFRSLDDPTAGTEDFLETVDDTTLDVLLQSQGWPEWVYNSQASKAAKLDLVFYAWKWAKHSEPRCVYHANKRDVRPSSILSSMKTSRS